MCRFKTFYRWGYQPSFLMPVLIKSTYAPPPKIKNKQMR